jgi:hypothetical protein
VQPVFFITMAALSFSRLVAVFYALHVDPIEDRNVKGESRCMQPDKAGALTLLPNLPVALNSKKKKKKKTGHVAQVRLPILLSLCPEVVSGLL